MKRKRVLQRAIALAMVCVLMTIDASAAVKHIYIYGVRSINDMGLSDNRIDMDTLVEDYSGFYRSDGLTEYFHKDVKSIPKTDMNEALSWLIDNNIINRDKTITVSNTNKIPNVNIDKQDMSQIKYSAVNRSDAVMYLYKAVFGPISGRTVGVETPNVRTDRGVTKTLDQIMQDNDYYTTISQPTAGIIQQGNTGGNFSVEQSCVSTPDGHYDHQSTTGAGGSAGHQELGVIRYNSDSKWRYTPQGDKVVSVFGDTNIFVSDIDISQQANTGSGQMGAVVGDNKGGSMGPGVEANDDRSHDSVTGEWSSQSGNHNNQNTGFGGTGGINAGINIDMDYKEIYYTCAADLLFYETSDVVEMYLQELESKGILPRDLAPNTKKFQDTFLPLTQSGAAMASWSGNADPYVVNMSANQKVRVEKVSYSNLRDLLGTNYSIRYANNRLTVSRVNLFNSNTGYFEDELLTRMDAYKYAYWMLFANEKKLTSLEVDIVNYKYGLQLSGLATSDDTEIAKYLIAKGILDYDGGHDMSGLYSSISWDDFFVLLYRVANPNARLDFSKIQLTDSENSWKAKGFQPLNVTVIDGDAPHVSVVALGSDGTDDTGSDEEIEDQETPLVSLPDIGPFVRAQALDFTAIPDSTGLESCAVTIEGTFDNMRWKDWYLHTYVWTVSRGDAIKKLDEYLAAIDSASREVMQSKHNEDFLISNPVHMIQRNFTSNYWFVCQTIGLTGQAGSVGMTEVAAKIQTKLDALIAERDKYDKDSQAYAVWDDKVTQLSGALTDFNSRCAEAQRDGYGIKCGPYSPTKPFNPTDLATTGQRLADILDEREGQRFQFGKFHMDLTADYVANLKQNKPNAKIAFTAYAQTSNADAAKRELAAVITTYSNTGVKRDGITTYTNGGDQYVTYDQLMKLGTITQWNGNEWILFNSANGVRAIFTNADTYKSDGKNVEQMSTALVGSAVITTAASTGVAYKDTTGGETKIMYHLDAIRALISATDDVEAVGTEFIMGVNDKDFNTMLKSYPVLSSTGVQNGSVSALSVCLARDIENPPAGIDTSSPYFSGITHSYGNVTTVWQDYLSVSETSNLVNYVTRRVQFEAGNGQTAVGYMVLSFEVDPQLADAAKKVNGGTMLQDILDTPNQRPTDTTDAGIWDSNKDQANLFANVIYRTSGKTYVQTGWLQPHLDFYVCGDPTYLTVPNSVFTPIKDAEVEGMRAGQVINTHELVRYCNGAVMKCVDNDKDLNYTTALSQTFATYWVSSDCKMMMSGERLYVNSRALAGVSTARNSKGEYCFVQVSNAANPASFTVGTTFTVQGDQNTPKLQGIVMETTDTGRIKCQIGPIKGYPIKFDGEYYVVKSTDTTSKLKFSKEDTGLFYVGKGPGTKDALYGSFLAGFKGIAFTGDEYKGIAQNPLPLRSPDDKSTGSYIVFDGRSAKTYTGRGTPVSGASLTVRTAAQGVAPFTICDEYVKWYNDHRQQGAVSMVYTHTYYNIEFDGTRYKIIGGELRQGSASATDFLSPELFTSLNNVIIDGMLGKTTGAIPINEVPEGALLQIGDCWYAAQGASADTKEFVGFASIPGAIQTATLQNTAVSYANHNIRAGSQMVNISHFFDQYKILDLINGTDKNSYQSSLDLVKQETMSSSTTNTKLVAVNTKGETTVLANDAQTTTAVYAAMSIKFQNYLMAFEDMSTDSGVKRYTILPTAVANTESESAAVDGALADVPFFENSVIERGIAERVSDVIASSYQQNYMADKLRDALQKDFEKIMAGDLITLVRFLLFIVIMWLILAAWLCFTARTSNLIPILDAIKHPSGDRTKNGIDLMKIVSLGTISLETEFGLGKFLQYNAILCVLLCVIMLTGRITIGGV